MEMCDGAGYGDSWGGGGEEEGVGGGDCLGLFSPQRVHSTRERSIKRVLQRDQRMQAASHLDAEKRTDY